MHVQRQTALPVLPDSVQHGGRSDHDSGDRPRFRLAWRGTGTARAGFAAKGSARRNRGVLCHEHRARGGGHRAVDRSERVASVARQLPLERPGIRRRGRRGVRCRRRRGPRPPLAGVADARPGLPDVSHLSGIPGPNRGSTSARRGNAQTAPRHTRSLVPGAKGRAGARGGEGAPGGDAAQHWRRRDHDRPRRNGPQHQQRRRNADRLDAGGSHRQAVRRRVSELLSRDAQALRELRRVAQPGRRQAGHQALHTARCPRFDRASYRRICRAAARRPRPGHRHGRGVPRHHRRAQGPGGTREGKPDRLARAAGGRHRARLQQHPDGDRRERVDGARRDAGGRLGASARRGLPSVRASA